MNDFDAFRGTVDEIIYINEDNGYAIFDLEDQDAGLITCVGTVTYIKCGEILMVYGKWVNHPNYGEQLKIEYFERIQPETKDSILTYLSSGVIKGIGKKMAERIVETFGEEALHVIADTPEKLSIIKGISHERAIKINQSYMTVYDKENLIMFLQKFDISARFSIKVYDILGKNAVEKIKENPYILCERIKGISFKTADRVASLSGTAKNSTDRIKAGIKYILAHFAQSEGHTYLEKEAIIFYTVKMLEVKDIDAENTLTKLLSDHELIVKKTHDGKDAIFLPALYCAERVIAESIKDICKNFCPPKKEITDKEIEKIEKEEGVKLAQKQHDAVMCALTSGMTVITGGPGTGKTTTINFLIKLFEKQGQKIALCAPTGRAAKRMTELSKKEAKTIHRLLEVGYVEEDILKEYSRSTAEPLAEDVIIVDEVSMVDAILMSSLISSVKYGARVILVGDADQLPSVGAGNVLDDIIKSGYVPTVALDTVFRQAEESMIVVNAHKINEGEYPVLNIKDKDFFFVEAENTEKTYEKLIELVDKRLPTAYGIDNFSDIQVISPMKKTAVGVNALNRGLQEILNPQDDKKAEKKSDIKTLRVGDKVMQIKNNYDLKWKREYDEGYGVYNGDIGRISEIKPTTVTVTFDDGKVVVYENAMLEELELAYAITVHKSQGSEFNTVIIPIFWGTEKLFSRNLLYTAITRAKNMVVLVGQRAALLKMVDNDYEAKRFSYLKELLLNE